MRHFSQGKFRCTAESLVTSEESSLFLSMRVVLKTFVGCERSGQHQLCLSLVQRVDEHDSAFPQGCRVSFEGDDSLRSQINALYHISPVLPLLGTYDALVVRVPVSPFVGLLIRPLELERLGKSTRTLERGRAVWKLDLIARRVALPRQIHDWRDPVLCAAAELARPLTEGRLAYNQVISVP